MRIVPMLKQRASLPMSRRGQQSVDEEVFSMGNPLSITVGRDFEPDKSKKDSYWSPFEAD